MNSSMSPSAISIDDVNGYSPSHDGLDGAHEPYDLVCVGFGPAALAIAVALHDSGVKRRVLFLERQAHFAWHSGMLLPSAKMQISFLKDLATFRDPRSYFTFLNYLHQKDRLAPFSNLNTFLPHREEFNDYLSWAASHFNDQVRYCSDTKAIFPLATNNGSKLWSVTVEDTRSHGHVSFAAKDVVIAVGGFPKLPRSLDSFGSKVVHSSQYLKVVPQLLPNNGKIMRVAVVGGGQSAAEIFEDLMERYPHVHATLYTSSAALKPSDDSPFVNEIFDPQRVDEFYHLDPQSREATVLANRATNYSVVRPELLDRLYEKMYHQRLHDADERNWQHRILGSHELVRCAEDGSGKLTLTFADKLHGIEQLNERGVDLVITGTGYVRNAHEGLLSPVKGLFENGPSDVDRDYRLRLQEGTGRTRGIWLQGCCEQSHGLSDSLLSILAVRGGEIVNSIFGESRGSEKKPAYTNGNGVSAKA